MGSSTFFRSKCQIPRQTANSAARRENPHAAEYCWPVHFSYILLLQRRHVFAAAGWSGSRIKEEVKYDFGNR